MVRLDLRVGLLQLAGLEAGVLQRDHRIGRRLIPLTSGTCTSRVLPPIMLIAIVTTTVSTASAATAMSHRPIDWPRSRSP